ncbi:MAG TPA: hypothetical protein VNL74_03005 [Methylococcus sp.]|nr:hypothetical protein [Methylococcus sp.]
MNLPRLFRFLLGYALAAGLLVLAAGALVRAKAAGYTARAGALLDFWVTHDSKTPSEAERKRVEWALRKAVFLDPANPDIHDRLSQFYMWQATQEPENLGALLWRIEEGLREARMTVAAQPGWPLAWAYLAAWKARFDLLDEEFHLALQRATVLGPWFYLVNRVLVSASFPVWKDIPLEDRPLVIQAAIRGLQQKDRETLRAIRESGHLGEVCAALPKDGDLYGRYCREESRPSSPVSTKEQRR